MKYINYIIQVYTEVYIHVVSFKYIIYMKYIKYIIRIERIWHI